jgi:hypothetical protein
MPTFAFQLIARVAELVDASVSKTDDLWSCGFDSRPGYGVQFECGVWVR